MRGEEVEVRLFAPVDGKKVYTGTLVSGGAESVEIRCGGETVKFGRSAVSKVSTVYNW